MQFGAPDQEPYTERKRRRALLNGLGLVIWGFELDEFALIKILLNFAYRTIDYRFVVTKSKAFSSYKNLLLAKPEQLKRELAIACFARHFIALKLWPWVPWCFTPLRPLRIRCISHPFPLNSFS